MKTSPWGLLLFGVAFIGIGAVIRWRAGPPVTVLDADPEEAGGRGPNIAFLTRNFVPPGTVENRYRNGGRGLMLFGTVMVAVAILSILHV